MCFVTFPFGVLGQEQKQNVVKIHLKSFTYLPRDETENADQANFKRSLLF